MILFERNKTDQQIRLNDLTITIEKIPEENRTYREIRYRVREKNEIRNSKLTDGVTKMATRLIHVAEHNFV
jgi:hypothetical protein